MVLSVFDVAQYNCIFIEQWLVVTMDVIGWKA